MSAGEPGKIVRLFLVRCFECGRGQYYESSNGKTIKRWVEVWARRDGWTKGKTGWICARCKPKGKEAH